MGLLDDLLYNASPDNGPGLLGYLNNGRTGSAPTSDPSKAATADELATALGLNNIGSTQNVDPNNAGMTNVPPPAAPAPGAPGAPSVPISQSNFTPAAAPAPAPMTSPVAAPQFGANPSPYLFPQSAAFGAPMPAPATPLNANAQAPAAAGADDEDETPAAPANASPIGVGNYQMPRIGPAAAFTPPAAAPAPAPAAPASPLAPVQNFLNRGADALQSVSRGGSLTGAIRGQYDDPTAKASQVGNLTARALIAKGVDPQTAMAAVQPGNGKMLEALLPVLSPAAFTQETDKDGNVWNVNKQTGQKTVALAAKDDAFQHVQTGEQLGGAKTFGAFNKKTGELKPDTGSASGAPGAPAFGSLLAQGVQYDPNKSGDEYMAQFSPEVQAAAKAYINGDVMPTGNQRKDSVATFAKTVAQKWGQDTGQPVSDNTYAAKRKMRIDLASSGNSSMGGILSNGESSFKHLAEYTASAADQGNASHNFPLGGYLAHAQNYIGNSAGGSDTQGKVKALKDNLSHYGQESTKFYAGTGGGVEERMHALKEMDPTTTSGEEAAAYAEKEKSLMMDRLNSKLQEIKNTLGEKEGQAEIDKHMPDIQKHLDLINANIARLRGEAPPEAAAASAMPKLDIGQSTTVNGVTIKKVSH